MFGRNVTLFLRLLPLFRAIHDGTPEQFSIFIPTVGSSLRKEISLGGAHGGRFTDEVIHASPSTIYQKPI